MIWHCFTKIQKFPEGKRGTIPCHCLLYSSFPLSQNLLCFSLSTPLSYFWNLTFSLFFSLLSFPITVTLFSEFIKLCSLLPESRINGCHRKSSLHTPLCMAIFNEACLPLLYIGKKIQFSVLNYCRGCNPNDPL